MAKKDIERIVQTRLGRQAITTERIIFFPQGLIGFEKEHEFILLQIRQESPFLILQSLHDPRLGLLVADPYPYIPDMEVKISNADQRILRIENIRQIAVLVTVSIPPGEPDKTSLNLTGPIVVNVNARVGMQIPQSEGRQPGQIFLTDVKQKTAEAARP